MRDAIDAGVDAGGWLAGAIGGRDGFATGVGGVASEGPADPSGGRDGIAAGVAGDVAGPRAPI